MAVGSLVNWYNMRRSGRADLHPDRALGPAMDELVDEFITRRIDLGRRALPNNFPLYSMAMRSAIFRALARSWVIDSAVAPSSRVHLTIRSLITSAMIGSSPVVGSSKKMISGVVAMARARPTRFCMPPESSAGHNSPTSAPSPTSRQLGIGDVAGLRAVRGRPESGRRPRFPRPSGCRTGPRPGTACRISG